MPRKSAAPLAPTKNKPAGRKALPLSALFFLLWPMAAAAQFPFHSSDSGWEDSCFRVQLEEPILQTLSAGWREMEDGLDHLLIVDSIREEILDVSPTGALLPLSLEKHQKRVKPDKNFPIRLQSIPDGPLIVQYRKQLVIDSLAGLDTLQIKEDSQEHAPVELKSLAREKVGNTIGQLRKVYGWTSFSAPDGGVAFASLVELRRSENGPNFVAFVVFNSNLEGKVLKEYKKSSDLADSKQVPDVALFRDRRRSSLRLIP